MSNEKHSPSSRRSFLQLTAAASAALACRIVTEPMLAYAERPSFPKDGILINSNENPLGPSAAARQAVANITPDGGRYLFRLTDDLVKTFAEKEGLKSEYVAPFAGSSPPLHYVVLAFCSPTASFVTADPGYEAGTHAARAAGARVALVPLTKSWSHDVKAMLAAGPDAGVFYVCSPNNPTGTLTSHADIEFLLANKPKGSIVMIDEAYLHFCDAPSALDLVKDDQDVVVLRTFSKLYGMAGLRCGFAIARPDLLKKIDGFGGGNPMPVTACAAAIASLNDASLVSERKRANTAVRQSSFAWLDSNGYQYSPSVSNCFMLHANRPAKEVIAAMAHQNVFIGRPWPAMPDWVRITVGTDAEMRQFQAAFQNVMKGTVVGRLRPAPPLRTMDGVVLPT